MLKAEVAVGEADGSIENTSEVTHNAALSSPSPGIAPAIDAAIPAPPAKYASALKSAVLPDAPLSCRSLPIAGSAPLWDSNTFCWIVWTSLKWPTTCSAKYASLSISLTTAVQSAAVNPLAPLAGGGGGVHAE